MLKCFWFGALAAFFAILSAPAVAQSATLPKCVVVTSPASNTAGAIITESCDKYGSARSASRSAPPVYGTAGGSYTAIGAMPISGAYGGMASGTTIGVVRWTNANYKLVIRGFTAELFIPTAFTTAQFVSIASYKLTNFTAAYSGGTDATAYFGTPQDSTMPALSGVNVRVANSGATGLMAGTRTRSNYIFITDPVWSGTVAGAKSSALVTLRGEDGAPQVLHANEGIEFVTNGAVTDATGTFAVLITLLCTVEPE